MQRVLGEIQTDALHQCGAGFTTYQVAFGLVGQMSRSGESKEAAAERHAKALHDGWGVGSALCNDGIVLFLSKADRQMHISTGAGAKGVLTDDHLDVVIERMRPLLKKGLYDAAVLQAALDVRDVAMEHALLPDGRARPVTTPSVVSAIVRERRTWYGWLKRHAVVFVVLGLFLLVMTIGYCESQKHARQTAAWEQARRRLQEVEQLARDAQQQQQQQHGDGERHGVGATKWGGAVWQETARFVLQ